MKVIHPPFPAGVMYPLLEGVKNSCHCSLTRYVEPAVTGHPTAFAQCIVSYAIVQRLHTACHTELCAYESIIPDKNSFASFALFFIQSIFSVTKEAILVNTHIMYSFIISHIAQISVLISSHIPIRYTENSQTFISIASVLVPNIHSIKFSIRVATLNIPVRTHFIIHSIAVKAHQKSHFIRLQKNLNIQPMISSHDCTTGHIYLKKFSTIHFSTLKTVVTTSIISSQYLFQKSVITVSPCNTISFMLSKNSIQSQVPPVINVLITL